MKIRSEVGYTVIDMSISIVVLFIFVSLIAFLSYYFNSSSKEIELKSQATYLAVEEIEIMKNKEFTEIANISIANGNSQYIPSDATKVVEEIENNPGFYRRVIIEDYADNHTDQIDRTCQKSYCTNKIHV